MSFSFQIYQHWCSTKHKTAPLLWDTLYFNYLCHQIKSVQTTPNWGFSYIYYKRHIFLIENIVCLVEN